ncbi:Fusicoccadiene synthase [Colletotrichum trifolii]|uniref:Fusicoccadiene synthase n=1 Tax=Colletotrichum trifolii TaxID=5466 RepID=A0A4R8QK49_COLTR|nr:Fusicoccadiene synthase [Colletotrichum trifolii]
MDNIWKYSVEIDCEVALSTGCFTSLAIRIHQRNDLADDATKRSIQDWGLHIGDGWERKSGSSWSPVGNWGAFIFPESLPERLGVITYLANMGNIHDDLCDDLTYEEALKEHRNLSEAMEISAVAPHQGPKAFDRSMKMKKYISKCLLEAMDIDRPRALRMINTYRSKWLDVMERHDVNEIDTLDEYLGFRNLNGGMEAFWSMVEFGMAMDVPDSDKTRIRPLFAAAESALVLTNDYWSWDREWRQAQQARDSRIVNAVHLFMRTQGLAMDEAKEQVRGQILAFEADFLRLKANFYAQNPDIGADLKKYIEVCGAITAGNHYWCANCPRHHSWRDQDSPLDPIGRNLSVSIEDTIDDDCAASPGATTSSSMSQKSSPATEVTPSEILSFTTISGGDERPQKLSDSPLRAPCQYIRSMPSKGLRQLMAEALDQWLLVDDASLDQIKSIIDLLHNSSLILDDIEDDSPLRRGLPATHMVFGKAQSINTANFMFVQAVQQAQTLANPACLEALLSELECLFVGQSWDLYWKFHLQIPTEQEYFEMVDSKTGAMFRLLTRLMFHARSVVASDQVAELLNGLCRLLGRFFQIRDDFMNLNSSEYSDLKGFCEDLDEGKMSYPMVLVMRQNPEYQDLIIGIFRQQTTNAAKGGSAEPLRLPHETKRYVLGLLKGSDAMALTLKKLQELEAAMEEKISDLEERFGETNPVMRIFLSRLSVRDVTLQ